jgi:beta-glucanase (GH16 family)
MSKFALKFRPKANRLAALSLMLVAVISGYIFIAARASTALPSDVNNDGKVDIFDLSAVLAAWGKIGATDVNGNGTTDIFDLSVLLAHWGQAGPTSTPTATPGPTATASVTPTTAPIGGGCAAGEIGAAPDCFPAPPGPLASGKQWKMLFNDEFNGTTLNTANFTPCFDWNNGACTDTFNNGREHYQPSQIQLSNGTAKLVAEPLSPPFASAGCLNGSCTYKSGLLSTARPNASNGSAYLHPFTYGYVEARMKYPATAGFFTAFWMLPTDPTYTYRSEIDIVEILGGDPTTIFMTYHYNNRASHYPLNVGDKNNGACAVKNYSQDFARFGIDWQPTYVAWYIDGVKCGQFDGNATTIENGPMQIILDLMVDTKWERDWGLTNKDLTQKQQLEVDYIRVYQQK